MRTEERRGGGERRGRAGVLGEREWVEAGFAALGEEGLAGIAVERVARRLGVTKGSFYWHFSSQDDLLQRVLDLWYQRDTEEVIAALAALPEPAARLAALFAEAAAPGQATRLLALAAAAGQQAVSAALLRASTRRIAHLQGEYRALGLDDEGAHGRAVLTYAAYVGYLHLVREGSPGAPLGAAGEPLRRHFLATLLPRAAVEAPAAGPARRPDLDVLL